QLVAMCSGDFSDQVMSAEQPQKPGDFAGRATLLNLGLVLGGQQRPYVAVSEAVDREFTSLQERGKAGVLAGDRVETASALTVTRHGRGDGIDDVPEWCLNIHGGQ